jgi:hypothetical protein
MEVVAVAAPTVWKSGSAEAASDAQTEAGLREVFSE